MTQTRFNTALTVFHFAMLLVMLGAMPPLTLRTIIWFTLLYAGLVGLTSFAAHLARLWWHDRQRNPPGE